MSDLSKENNEKDDVEVKKEIPLSSETKSDAREGVAKTETVEREESRSLNERGVDDYGQRVPEKRPGDWTCPSCGANVFASKIACYQCRTPRPESAGPVRPPPKVARRPGDWTCPKCEATCFASKNVCFRCQMPRPNHLRGMMEHENMRPGDWTCPSCRSHCYASRTSCFRCGTPKMMMGGMMGGGMYGGGPFGGMYGGGMYGGGMPQFPPPRSQHNNVRPGDWTCPSCQSNCFASRSACFRCQTPKPSHLGPAIDTRHSNVRPGDWTCPECKANCYASRTRCFRCQAPKPEDAGGRFDDRSYRRRSSSRDRGSRRRSRSRSRSRSHSRSRSRVHRERSRE